MQVILKRQSDKKKTRATVKRKTTQNLFIQESNNLVWIAIKNRSRYPVATNNHPQPEDKRHLHPVATVSCHRRYGMPGLSPTGVSPIGCGDQWRWEAATWAHHLQRQHEHVLKIVAQNIEKKKPTPYDKTGDKGDILCGKLLLFALPLLLSGQDMLACITTTGSWGKMQRRPGPLSFPHAAMKQIWLGCLTTPVAGTWWRRPLSWCWGWWWQAPHQKPSSSRRRRGDGWWFPISTWTSLARDQGEP